MTNSKTIKTAASSSLLRPTTLILAAVVALEVVGMRALPQGDLVSDSFADADTFAIAQPAAAPAPKRVASVEIRIVAQADTPAR